MRTLSSYTVVVGNGGDGSGVWAGSTRDGGGDAVRLAAAACGEGVRRGPRASVFGGAGVRIGVAAEAAGWPGPLAAFGLAALNSTRGGLGVATGVAMGVVPHRAGEDTASRLVSLARPPPCLAHAWKAASIARQ